MTFYVDAPPQDAPFQSVEEQVLVGYLGGSEGLFTVRERGRRGGLQVGAEAPRSASAARLIEIRLLLVVHIAQI